MKIREIIVFVFIIVLCSCSKTHDINEEDLKNFVIEYDNALSKGWSESDEIIPIEVENNFFTSCTGLDHCSNERWFVYEDEIVFRDIEKVPKAEFDLFGKNAYCISYKKKILYEIKSNCLVPVLNDRDKYGNAGVWVAQVDNDLKVTFYYPDSCWVKEKHLPALIKRKGLVVVK